MASAISTEKIRQEVMIHVLADPKAEKFDHYLRNEMVKNAIISADRELHRCDSLMELAWHIEDFSGFRTVAPADISAITQANPGVITAASRDSDVDAHGFHDEDTLGDIILLQGIDGMEELNDRLYLLEYIDDDTFSLKSFDGLDNDIVTTALTEYSSGGTVYHAGFVIPTATVLAGVSTAWSIKRILPSPTFDGFPTEPISEGEVNSRPQLWQNGSQAQRPLRWREWKNMTKANTYLHYLLWYPPANWDYNLTFPYEKEIPDISAWTTATYPFHPSELHHSLVDGACSLLAGHFASLQRFVPLWADAKIKARHLSRVLRGQIGGIGGISA